ncbi:MAG: hypothetical protein IH987_07300 [Planctomycetes bacterium]|nr:hypothetical protein [Planctomycetota bacterium]
MRIVTVLVATWSLVGAPLLCTVGVLVECCRPAHRADEESNGCPDDCPHRCPDESPEDTPGDTDTSNERDCSSCADVCSSMSLPPEKMAGGELQNTPAPAVATTAALADVLPSSLDALPGECKRMPRQKLPYPTSDRPLLI